MNVQNPGNLWYHDHAMHLTQYNVANGLYGIYIIRDPKV
jgi:FtsP/CotA-like multicopper oxidase with cupredoxin domain